MTRHVSESGKAADFDMRANKYKTRQAGGEAGRPCVAVHILGEGLNTRPVNQSVTGTAVSCFSAEMTELVMPAFIMSTLCCILSEITHS